MVVLDADRLIIPDNLYCQSRYRMSTLGEITKEKQRVSEALARVEAQREKLAGQLVELEATERVLARYSKGSGARKTASAKDANDGNKCGCSSASTRAPAQYDDETSWRQAQLAVPQRSGSCSGSRQDAAGNRRRMQGGARTTSVPPFPRTTGPAAPNSGMATST